MKPPPRNQFLRKKDTKHMQPQLPAVPLEETHAKEPWFGTKIGEGFPSDLSLWIQVAAGNALGYNLGAKASS